MDDNEILIELMNKEIQFWRRRYFVEWACRMELEKKDILLKKIESTFSACPTLSLMKFDPDNLLFQWMKAYEDKNS